MGLILGDDDEAPKSRSFVSSECPAGTLVLWPWAFPHM